MKKLILLRHADSDWNDAKLRDFDRPLNEHGEKNAQLMGKRLCRLGVKPGRIISSPAKRARDTLRQLTFIDSGVVFQDAIYEAGVDDLLDVVRNLPQGLQCVMLIGHNPGLTELARVLGALIDSLPPCAAVGLELKIEHWKEVAPGTGRLWLYDDPKHPDPGPLDKVPEKHKS